MSQASPRLSPSMFFWLVLGTVWQLSDLSGTPSLSWSSSHASPTPSPSASSWPELGTEGQLSPSQETIGQWTDASGQPSLSLSRKLALSLSQSCAGINHFSRINLYCNAVPEQSRWLQSMHSAGIPVHVPLQGRQDPSVLPGRGAPV